MNDDDVRTMIFIFCQHSTRGTIELDASLVRSVEEIRKSLFRPRNHEKIRALIDAPDEENSLDEIILLCALCCFYYVFYVVFYYAFYVVELSCYMLLN